MAPQLRRYFEGLVLLYLTAGFATLASTGRLPWWLALIAGLAYAARAVLYLWRIEWRLPVAWLWIGLALYLPLFCADGFWWSGNWLDACLRLVILAGTAKLLATRLDGSESNLFGLGLLAFLEVLAAALLTVSGLFFVLFLCFLGLLVATLVAREMVAGAPPQAAAAKPYRTTAPRAVLFSLLRFSGLLSFVVAGLSVVIFFLLPRTTLSSWGGPSRGSGISGFSDEVRLGAIGDLQRSDTPVMHIRLLSSDPPLDPAAFGQFPFRGRGLTTFDGQRWFDSAPPSLFGTRLGQFEVGLGPRRSPAQMARYQVTLEPMASPVLFFPAHLLRASTRYGALAWDPGTDTLTAPNGNFSGTAYTGVSDLAQPAPDYLRAAPAISDSRTRFRMQPYLQLPGDLDSRIRSLARSATANVAPDAYDRMEALTQFLQTHYQYSLDDLPQGADPLSAFLFDQQSGDCEYFASALAVMARTLGIPTRVVNGFVLGAYNAISGEYLVRGSDAHSWVEAYFPSPSDGYPRRGYGVRGEWVTFDATPPATSGAASSWAGAGMFLDALSSAWQEWIVNYDWMHQAGIVRRLQQDLGNGATQALAGGTHAAATAAQAAESSLSATPGRQWLEISAWLLLLIGCAYGLIRAAARRRRSHDVTSPAERQARAAYLRFQRYLARVGVRRAPAQTPDELLQAMARVRMPAETVASAAVFLTAYQQARFSRGGGTRQLQPALAIFRQNCRRPLPGLRGAAH